MPQRKIKRVSDEHTRDRVRNNQRQHRARRRDYIATIEGKLEEAEKTISSLKEQIKILNQDDGNRGLGSLDSSRATRSESLTGRDQSFTIEDPDASLGSHVTLSVASPTLLPAPIFTYPTPEFLSETTDYVVNTHSFPNLQSPISTPGFLMDPRANPPCQESTILCSEAYILIAHQNHKHVSESTIAAFLWPSFRASTSPNEGCRVATSTLYTLLAFISDVSSTYQELS